MAILYPKEVMKKTPRSEKKVRRWLGEGDGIVVLHSVGWQARRRRKQADGEADFVVLVPGRGILVLEVKGGSIVLKDGSWYSTSRNGTTYKIKDPFEQAKDSKYALVNYFDIVDKRLKKVPIVHAVAFPDIRVEASLGIQAPSAIILDCTDLQKPCTAILKIFDYWETSYPLSENEIELLVNHLAPTITVQALLCDVIGDTQDALLTLTNEQTWVLQLLRRVKRAAVLGGAGTGKTMLAIEKAKQLSSAGLKCLLVCYNGPLRQHLVNVLRCTEVEVESFHSIVMREARSAKLAVPSSPTVEWFEKTAPQVLIEAVQINAVQYDAIIIDEAQDFAPSWLEASELLIEEDGYLYIFADSHQNLYRRGWMLPDNINEYELSINCRNTKQIASKVANIFGDSIESRLVDGPEPVFVTVDKFDQFAPKLVELAEDMLVEQKLSPPQFLILTDSGSLVSSLRTMGVCEYLFTSLDEHGIPVETIHRFKGLERDVVVLALSDQLTKNELQSLAYVGLSRAKVALFVVGSSQVRRALGWDV